MPSGFVCVVCVADGYANFVWFIDPPPFRPVYRVTDVTLLLVSYPNPTRTPRAVVIVDSIPFVAHVNDVVFPFASLIDASCPDAVYP